MTRIDSTRAIEKIWNAECKNGQLLYWNYNEECWAIKDDLKLLTKYKRAFKILKDKFHLDILEDGYFSCIDLSYDSVNPDNLPKEEYELLKELLKG